jgi:hypothetical protein
MVQHHAQVYNWARQSIVNLGAKASLLDRYKALACQDLRIDTAILAPDVRGQWNKSLPWFWSMDIHRDANVGVWMNDCKHILFHMCSDRYSNHGFKSSLPSALAKSKGLKDMVD